MPNKIPLFKIYKNQRCSPGEGGALHEPAGLQLQGQEHPGDAPLHQAVIFHLQKGISQSV